MITITDYAAALNKTVPELAGAKHVLVLPPPATKKTTSPCAAYALAAVGLLSGVSQASALVTLSGATGNLAEAFDNAWTRSPDGRLCGEGFAQSRYKRIHPLTLIRSMQNQVPAVLSMTLGIKGACLNALEGEATLADLLVNIVSMLDRHPSVLLVLATAGDRGEERAKQLAYHAPGAGLEGAICFLLCNSPGLAIIETRPDFNTASPKIDGPAVLVPGLAFLSCLVSGKSGTFILRDGDYSRAIGLRIT